MIMDFHTHSNTSFDSVMSVKELIKNAKLKGIKNICITNHYEPKVKDMTGFHLTEKKLEDYKKELNELKKEITGINIYFGVEVGYDKDSEKETREFLKNNKFDFVIGSNHFVEEYWVSSKRMMRENDKKYNYFELMNLFFESLKNLIKSDMFDVIRHIDIIRKTIPEYKYENHITEWKEIAKLMKKYDIGFEINTSLGRILGHIDHAYPEKRLRKLLIDEGIDIITIGSDAHKTEDIGNNILEAKASLKELGINKLCIFKQRKKEYVDI